MKMPKNESLIAAARHCAREVGCAGCSMEKVTHCQRVLLNGLADALENKQREADAATPARNAVTNAAPAMDISEKQEKRETLERLQTYRQKFGMGAYGRLARISGKLSSEAVRSMAMGERCPAENWRVLASALDKAEKNLQTKAVEVDPDNPKGADIHE